MAAVLNGFHNMYSSPPSSPPPSSPTDWKERYYEVSDLLAETRAELDDFTRTSRELEEELEKDLERTEKAQEELRAKVIKVENERDEWKSKFLSLQHNHNTTTSSLERELDATRQSLQIYKAQVRELEMGNDDLERNERQATSSLADFEQRYAKALEDKILLEHELQDKAVLEESCQRLRDELRDTNLEVTVLRGQVEQLKQLPLRPSLVDHHTTSSSSLPLISPTGSDQESLLRTAAPDLSLEDLLPATPVGYNSARSSLQSRLSLDAFDDYQMARASPTSFTSAKGPRATVNTTPTQQNFLQRTLSPTSSAVSTTSTRLPTPRRRGPPTPTPAPPASPQRIPRLQPKSKGVQMVSDMRARVRTLEQKIHSTMPRIRVASTINGGPPVTSRARAPSRAGAGSEQGNVRTPRKSIANVPKDPASPWVMIADDGAGNTTIRQSPERPPQIPPVPNISPIASGSDFNDSNGSIRPPSRTTTSGPRFPSTLSRPAFGPLATEHSSNPRSRTPLPPPTAFPSLNVGPGPARPSSATAFRPPARIVTFAASTAHTTSVPPISPLSEGRPTTPTHLPRLSAGSNLRRAHTTSSPTKPPTILSRSPRKETAHKANTANAGTTPGRTKGRAVTSPDTPPPPVPSIPTAHATSKNLILGQSRIAVPAGLAKARVTRPGSHGALSKGGENDQPDDAEDRVRAAMGRLRSGTLG